MIAAEYYQCRRGRDELRVPLSSAEFRVVPQYTWCGVDILPNASIFL